LSDAYLLVHRDKLAAPHRDSLVRELRPSLPSNSCVVTPFARGVADTTTKPECQFCRVQDTELAARSLRCRPDERHQASAPKLFMHGGSRRVTCSGRSRQATKHVLAAAGTKPAISRLHGTLSNDRKSPCDHMLGYFRF